MARIGCFSYSGVGHVSPLLALARKLQARGHQLLFFQLPDLQTRIRAAHVPFAAYGVNNFPVGSLSQELWEMSQLGGLAAFERVIASLVKECRIVLHEGPELIREHKISRQTRTAFPLGAARRTSAGLCKPRHTSEQASRCLSYHC